MTEVKIASLIVTYLGSSMRLASADVMRMVMMLQQSAPKDASPQQKKRLRELVAGARDVDAIHKERARISPTRLAEPRNNTVNAWFAMHEALGAGGRLPDEVSHRGARCREMQSKLFSKGTDFLRLHAGRVWSEGHRMLERIEEEGLEPELDSLIGEDFLAGVRRAMKALGDAIGVHGAPAPSSSALAEAMASFQMLLANYARSLAGDVDERDPESVARFFAAVAPIDQFRATRTNGEDEEEEEPVVDEPTEPTEPTPTS